MFVMFSQKVVCYDVSYGALTQLYAGTMPEAVNYNGKVRSTSSSYDPG